jgi:VWFA-related protein
VKALARGLWLPALSAVSLVAAIQARQTPVVPQQPVFRVGVDHVAVDVVVTDSHDTPVTDLKPGEFRILDNGKPQTIADVQYVSVPVEHETAERARPAVPEPDVATNVPPSPRSRLFVLVIDDLHILESQIVPLKRVMAEFLQALAPDDQVAVVFVGHSNLSENFTTDRARILKTLDRVRAALGFGLDAFGMNDPRNGRFVLSYGRSVASVLKNVAMSLAGSENARRAIVYVSNGVALDREMATEIGQPGQPEALELYHYLDDAYATAKQADVPIYTLDPRGLAMPEDAVRGGISVIHSEIIREQIAHNITIQQNYLSDVAINTGGRAFINQSNPARAIDEIVAENGSFYLLGYYPNPFVRDGRFHDISVHVTRPGVRVRARSGYMAPSASPATASAKDTLDTALGAGVDVSALSLRAFAAPVQPGAKGMTTVVTIEVAYPVQAGGPAEIDDTLRTSVLALDPDGKVKASSTGEMHFSGRAPRAGPAVFMVDDAIDLPSQPLTLRVGVASRALGKAGTIQLPIDPLRPSDSKLQLSGIVIGLASAREGAMRADAIRTLVPFQPTTTRTFRAADALRVFARAFWKSEEAAVEATLAVTGAGSGMTPRTITLPSSSGRNGHREATLDTTVPLAGLARGSYALAITARLTNGQTAARTVPFVVR